MKMGNTLIFEPKDLPCLAASRNLELDIAVQGRHLYLITKGSLSNVEW